jgi:hypothetical protein
MSLPPSPAFSLRRISLRANSRLIVILIIGVIAVASVALFYQLRHEPGVKKPDKVKIKAPKEDGGKKKKKKKNKAGTPAAATK